MALLCITAMLPLAGCSDRKESTRVEEVVGTIEEIDLANNRVKVKAYVEKQESYHTFVVHISDDTEVMINGSLAKLTDVHEGERAEGRVRITRKDGVTTFTALAVKIERGEVLAAPGTPDAGAAGDATPPSISPRDMGTSGAEGATTPHDS
jgi:hypothetical protein